MSIKSQMSQDGKELVISVEGRFDFSSLQLFRNAYKNNTSEPDVYTVDLKDSDYLDSSALGMLLALRDHAGGDQSDIRIINCNADVKKILVITKLNELFTVQ